MKNKKVELELSQIKESIKKIEKVIVAPRVIINKDEVLNVFTRGTRNG